MSSQSSPRTKYCKSKREEYNVLYTIRLTPKMDASIDKYLASDAAAAYESKSDFIRDAIYQWLEQVKGVNTGSTVLGGLRLLSLTAQAEQQLQSLAETVKDAEGSLKFYLKENKPEPLAEVLGTFDKIVADIDNVFWQGYLRECMDQSAVFQEARRLVGGQQGCVGGGAGQAASGGDGVREEEEGQVPAEPGADS